MNRKSKQKKNKSNMILFVYAILYTLISINFIADMKNNESGSLLYIAVFPIFWIVAGLLFGILFWLKIIKIKTILDYIVLIFSTPVPTLIFAFIWTMVSFSRSPGPKTTTEFNKDGHRWKETKFEYSIGNLKRIEYYRSQDTVTDTQQFPTHDIWLKDSIWIFYDVNGKVEKTEDYRNK